MIESRAVSVTWRESMEFKLTEKQLQWLIADRRFTESTVHILRRYYVEQIPRKDVIAESGQTRQAISKILLKLEEIVKEKVEKQGLVVTMVFHQPELLNQVLELDTASRK